MFAIENTLRIPLLRVVFVAIIILRNGRVAGGDTTAKEDTCNSPECVKSANMFRKNMDLRVNPCDDFYAYACGNWEANNPKPSNAGEWTVYTIMKTKSAENKRELLQSSLRHTLIGQMFKLCLDKPYLQKNKPSVIASYVKNSKYFPMILNKEEAKSRYQPWWTIDNYYVKLTGESAFFNSDMIPDIKFSGRPMQNLYDLISPYGSIVRFEQWDRKSVLNYKNFLMGLIKMLTPFKIHEASVWKNVEKVVKFRCKLKKIIKSTKDDDDDDFDFDNNDDDDKSDEELLALDPKPIQQFQQWYDNHTYLKKSLMVNWLEIIRSLYGPKHNAKINSDTIINVSRKKYFLQLIDLLKLESEETIVNHIQLYFMERYTELNSNLQDMLYKATLENFEPTGRLRYLPDRWRACLDKLSTSDTLSMAYVDAVFKPKNIKAKVERLFTDLKDIIKEQIADSTWLDSKTKHDSIMKLVYTKVWCGYPEWYDNPSFKWKYPGVDMDPTVTNAYLVIHRNLVLINAAILRYPMYSKALPYVMKHASTGALIAHELYHEFGQEGLLYNFKGEYSLSHWSSKMLSLYDQRKQCFVNQYNNYDIKELAKTEKPLKCNGELTYDENVADVMGLKAAYRLYTKKKLQKNGACDVLPGFEKYSCDQFFFLSFASSLCGVISKDFLRHYLKLSTHALPRLRVNGVLSNLDEFSAAYKCGPKTPMNRRKKCDLWK